MVKNPCIIYFNNYLSFLVSLSLGSILVQNQVASYPMQPAKSKVNNEMEDPRQPLLNINVNGQQQQSEKPYR